MHSIEENSGSDRTESLVSDSSMNSLKKLDNNDKDLVSPKTENDQFYKQYKREPSDSSNTSGFQGRIKLNIGERRLSDSSSSSSSACSDHESYSVEFSSSSNGESNSDGSVRVPAKIKVSPLKNDLIAERPSDVAIAVEKIDS